MLVHFMAVTSILCPYGIFMVIWYIVLSFGIFFPVLVFFTKKNLATLISESILAPSPAGQLQRVLLNQQLPAQKELVRTQADFFHFKTWHSGHPSCPQNIRSWVLMPAREKGKLYFYLVLLLFKLSKVKYCYLMS
jgi:hypothetical protein